MDNLKLLTESGEVNERALNQFLDAVYIVELFISEYKLAELNNLPSSRSPLAKTVIRECIQYGFCSE